MFSNGGNYGLPVVSFAFGEEALSYGTVFFLTGSVLTNTVGAFLAAAGRRSLRTAAGERVEDAGDLRHCRGDDRARNRYRRADAAAAAHHDAERRGAAADDPRARHAARARALPTRPALVAAAVCVSLLVAPLVALGLTSLLNVSGPARQAVVVLSSMPVAVVTTILALEFDASPEFVTSAVFLSTILSPLTLTPLIAYLR